MSLQEAILGAMVNMLFHVNFFANPIIYAQTIPAVKEAVQNTINGTRSTRGEGKEKTERTNIIPG